MQIRAQRVMTEGVHLFVAAVYLVLLKKAPLPACFCRCIFLEKATLVVPCRWSSEVLTLATLAWFVRL